MENLYCKFEEAKSKYYLNEKNKEKLLQGLSLTDNVVIQTYKSENDNVVLCKKEIDFSCIEEEYYILHEEDNNEYFKINRYRRENGGDYIHIIDMYILIPKNLKRKTLALYIKRIAPAPARIELYGESYDKTFSCLSNVYVESSIFAGLSEYVFYRSKAFNSHSGYSNFTIELKIQNFNYTELVKKYVKDSYFDEVLDFVISSSEDFERYVEQKKEVRNSGLENLLASVFKETYYKLKEEKENFEVSTVVGDYEIKYKGHIQYEWVKSTIEDKKNNILGFANIKAPIMKIDLQMYYKGNLVDTKKIKFIEGKKNCRSISDYVTREFYVNV